MQFISCITDVYVDFLLSSTTVSGQNIPDSNLNLIVYITNPGDRLEGGEEKEKGDGPSFPGAI